MWLRAAQSFVPKDKCDFPKSLSLRLVGGDGGETKTMEKSLFFRKIREREEFWVGPSLAELAVQMRFPGQALPRLRHTADGPDPEPPSDEPTCALL